MSTYRAGLPPRPSRIAALPLDERGYPIPYFVATVGGVPDFRLADDRKLHEAVAGRRCWICGQPLGRVLVYAVGPISAMNRISGEPPSHRDCAEYAVQACPFLLLPRAERRDAGIPPEAKELGGVMIRRNPGVTALWATENLARFTAPGGLLFRLGEPSWVSWWAQGRRATRAEVQASFFAGLDEIRALCADQAERLELEDSAARAVAYWPPRASWLAEEESDAEPA